MPSRILREGINDSKRINALSESAELLYRRLFSVVDDYGLYRADLKFIRATVFLERFEAWPEQRIALCLKECVDQEAIKLYEVDGKEYLQILRFDQKIRSKPKWPRPEGARPVQMSLLLSADNLSATCPQPAGTSRQSSIEVRNSYCVSRQSSVGAACEQPGSAAASEQPGGKPTTTTTPTKEHIAWIRAALETYTHGERGKPPEHLCREIAEMLSPFAEPIEQLRMLLTVKNSGGYQPERWRWFKRVIENAIAEGELPYEVSALQRAAGG